MFPCVTVLYRGLCCHPRWRTPCTKTSRRTSTTSSNPLTFCTSMFAAGADLRVLFSFLFIFHLFFLPLFSPLSVRTDNLASRYLDGIFRHNFRVTRPRWATRKRVVSEMTESRGKPRGGKRHPHDFLTPNAFTAVWCELAPRFPVIFQG